MNETRWHNAGGVLFGFAPFLAPASDRFCVRVVVLRYIDARWIAGMPVLRGRAFSRETDTAGLS